MPLDFQCLCTKTISKAISWRLTFVVSLTFFTLNLTQAQINFEMRGAWVATVMNIDWPSKPGLDPGIQRQEAITILDKAKSMGFNAIFLQVRPVADAIYPSVLEPWSAFLSGKEGMGPKPMYDPLQFWIEQAHRRGLELHAWINPFRASLGSNREKNPSNAVVKHPDWLVRYGERHYFDPGLPQVRQYLFEVVSDLVSRYDINGIHIDDYFYPYPIKDEVFIDSKSFGLYGAGMELKQWRRQNVDLVIRGLNETIKNLKPWVKFGVSPFGVWRNKSNDPRGSDTRAGVQCYDDLNADILLWEREGWIDYIIPQIYWSTRELPANYITLLDWWNTVTLNRHLYIGHALYKINASNKTWENPGEMSDQIKTARQRKNVRGSVFFSMVHLDRSDLFGLQDSLSGKLYRVPALPPPMPWLGQQRPLPVKNLEIVNNLISWQGQHTDNIGTDANKYLVILEPGSRKAKAGGRIIFVTGQDFFELPKRPKNERARYNVCVIAVNRLSNLSDDNPRKRITY